VPLQAQRLEAVATILRARGVARILDLGCGDCKLLALLAPDARFTELVGVDASPRQLGLGRN
jgi:cyclopropane fatty-acyl-phospholipid synthase-like methyltransferase